MKVSRKLWSIIFSLSLVSVYAQASDEAIDTNKSVTQANAIDSTSGHGPGGGGPSRPSPAPSFSRPTPSPSFSRPTPSPSFSRPSPAPSFQAPRPPPPAPISRPQPFQPRPQPIERPQPIQRPQPFQPIQRPQPTRPPVTPVQPNRPPFGPNKPPVTPVQPNRPPVTPVQPSRPPFGPNKPPVTPVQPNRPPVRPPVNPPKPAQPFNGGHIPAVRPSAIPPLKPGARPISVMPNRPVITQAPQHVQSFQRPSNLFNPRTQNNLNRAVQLQNKFRQNHGIVYAVNDRSDRYRRDRRPWVERRGPRLGGFYHNDHFRFGYRKWWHRGFYGGFWYPVRPCWDIDRYFYHSMVYWLWADRIAAEEAEAAALAAEDAEYYSNYYNDDDDYTGASVDAFPYAGVYYPTDSLEQLAAEVSAMSYDAQNAFRADMTILTDKLREAISANLQYEFDFDQNDIVINHYQNLQDQALVVEGFVSHGDNDNAAINVSFKALLDLYDPTQTLVFVPNSEDDSDSAILDAINARIVALGGGDQTVACEEPAQATNPDGSVDSSMLMSVQP